MKKWFGRLLWMAFGWIIGVAMGAMSTTPPGSAPVVVTATPTVAAQQAAAQSEAVAAPTEDPEPTATPEPAVTLYLGDKVEQHGYSLVAHVVEDPATRPSIFHEDQPGKKLVAVEFSVGNVSGSDFESNVLNAVLIDTEGYLYQAEAATIDNPIQLLTVAPGQIVRGWAGFIVPESAQPASLTYGFNYGRQPITVSLTPRP